MAFTGFLAQSRQLSLLLLPRELEILFRERQFKSEQCVDEVSPRTLLHVFKILLWRKTEVRYSYQVMFSYQ